MTGSKGEGLMASPKSIRTVSISACTRIDLLGGTLDIWPMYLFFPGAVTVNAAVNRMVTVNLRIKEHDSSVIIRSTDIDKTVKVDHWEELSNMKGFSLFYQLLQYFNLPQGVEIATATDFPRGSGLGGSSSLLIAAILGFLKLADRVLKADEIVRLAKDLEARALKVPTGIQDYYPPLYGGLNCICLEPGDAVRKSITCNLGELEKRLLLCYSGQAHFSGKNNWAVFKGIIEGNEQSFGTMRAIAENSRKGVHALEKEDLNDFALLVDIDWSLRKELFPDFTTEKIEQIIRIGKHHGAIAGKACGAGGGGCVALLCNQGKKETVREALDIAGVSLLDFSLCATGHGWRFQGGIKDP
jgi:D-glycero-alpha-D-manno-heptose-7-phosphate kinase